MSKRSQARGRSGAQSRGPRNRSDEKHSRTARGLTVAAVLGLAVGAGLFALTRGDETAHATETADVAAAPRSVRHIHVKADQKQEQSAPAAKVREPLPQSTGPDDPPEVDRAALPRVLPAPSYHPRPEGEWDGMLVDTSIQPYCAGAASCGLGRACIENRCTVCSRDSDCARGEACVLDHCVEQAKVTCRSREDCRGDELCVLSGYSADPRGNRDMEATCMEPRGGEEPDPSLVFDPDEIAEGQVPIPPVVDIEAMREEIAEAKVPESFFETPEEEAPAEPEELPEELLPEAPSDLLEDLGRLEPTVDDQPDEPNVPEAETDPNQDQQPQQVDPSEPVEPAPGA